MCKNPLDFCQKIGKKLKNQKNKSKFILTTILLVTMGCFFYSDSVKSQIIGVDAKHFSGIDKELSEKVAKEYDFKNNNDESFLFEEQKGIDQEILVKNNLEEGIKEITKNHPIEEMAPFIANYDKRIAALIVGIAKKESNWGFHSPSKNGRTCYNYWGYKGQGSRGVAMGYGCFDSPKEAVDAIGGRIDELVNKKKIDTPQKMVVWKCGSSCAGHDPSGVRKWISDVSIYFNKINNIAS